MVRLGFIGVPEISTVGGRSDWFTERVFRIFEVAERDKSYGVAHTL
jgi:hypothetical protein